MSTRAWNKINPISLEWISLLFFHVVINSTFLLPCCHVAMSLLALLSLNLISSRPGMTAINISVNSFPRLLIIKCHVFIYIYIYSKNTAGLCFFVGALKIHIQLESHSISHHCQLKEQVHWTLLWLVLLTYVGGFFSFLCVCVHVCVFCKAFFVLSHPLSGVSVHFS